MGAMVPRRYGGRGFTVQQLRPVWRTLSQGRALLFALARDVLDTWDAAGAPDAWRATRGDGAGP